MFEFEAKKTTLSQISDKASQFVQFLQKDEYKEKVRNEVTSQHGSFQVFNSIPISSNKIFISFQ